MGGTGWNWQSKLIVACTCGGVVVGGVGWLASEHPITRPRTASGWCFWLRLGELFLVLELDDLEVLVGLSEFIDHVESDACVRHVQFFQLR